VKIRFGTPAKQIKREGENEDEKASNTENHDQGIA
jgi:hypothetical protein